MKQERKTLIILFLSLFLILPVKAQETIPATGGNAEGSGGTVSYTFGQVFYKSFPGTNGSVVQGVQQPYEISVVSALENAKDISLELSVFPNPTRGVLKLMVKSSDLSKLRYQLYQLNGLLLIDKKIENEATEISLEIFPPSVYLLKVVRKGQEVKVFNIIKN
jgi:hypothetical protein